MMTDSRDTLESLSRRLDEALDRQSLALEACGAGVWDWDVKSGRLYWDAATRDLFGVAVFGGTYADFERCVEPHDAEQVAAHLKQAIRDHTLFDFTFRLTSRPGVILRGRGKCYYENGVATRFVGVNVEETRARPPVCPIAFPGCPSHVSAICPMPLCAS